MWNLARSLVLGTITLLLCLPYVLILAVSFLCHYLRGPRPLTHKLPAAADLLLGKLLLWQAPELTFAMRAATSCLRSSARLGNPTAAFTLAKIVSNEFCCSPTEFEEGLGWMVMACEGGSAAALHYLGFNFLTGSGNLMRDGDKAKVLYLRCLLATPSEAINGIGVVKEIQDMLTGVTKVYAERDRHNLRKVKAKKAAPSIPARKNQLKSHIRVNKIRTMNQKAWVKLFREFGMSCTRSRMIDDKHQLDYATFRLFLFFNHPLDAAAGSPRLYWRERTPIFLSCCLPSCGGDREADEMEACPACGLPYCSTACLLAHGERHQKLCRLLQRLCQEDPETRKKQREIFLGDMLDEGEMTAQEVAEVVEEDIVVKDEDLTDSEEDSESCLLNKGKNNPIKCKKSKKRR